MHDPALKLLAPYLQQVSKPTLWYADENALPLMQQLDIARNHLYIICNRYDIYQLAVKRKFAVEYNDFNTVSCKQPARILYRVSKEKSLVHYLLKLSTHCLRGEGELVLTGQKQDGIKSYHNRLLKTFLCRGYLKKTGSAYAGNYTHFQSQIANDELAEDHYHCLEKVLTGQNKIPFFYSKPGVFGWKKIDQGSELLLSCLYQQLDAKNTPSQSLLDLGCGYGWLFMNLGCRYQFDKIVATDNNPAALLCARKNSAAYALNVDVVASDAGDGLTETFGLIVCNPPFHQGFKHSQTLSRKFINAVADKLDKNGSAFLVVNEFVPVEKLARGCSLETTLVSQRDGFKLLKLTH